jgi:hypothetical protein
MELLLLPAEHIKSALQHLHALQTASLNRLVTFVWGHH